MSVQLSVCTSAWNKLSSTGWIFIKFYFLVFSENPSKNNPIFFKKGLEQMLLYMKTNKYFLAYLAHFFLEWEMFQTKVVEKMKTRILFPVTFFRKSCRLW